MLRATAAWPMRIDRAAPWRANYTESADRVLRLSRAGAAQSDSRSSTTRPARFSHPEGQVTSWHSLLGCAQADVTIVRIASLTATTGTEPLTVDFKEKATPRLAECVASMANAHGGLIFVGLTDTDRKITGVKTETMAHVADMLAARLDPADWLPEMFEVPLGSEEPGMKVLVLRIRRELAPRPVLVQRTADSGHDKTTFFWIPVRMPGGTRQATRAEMAALFAEQPAGPDAVGGWDFDAPRIPSGDDGLDDTQVDMMLKTGLRITPGPACPGRPLLERAISELAVALDKSPLADVVFTLTGLKDAGLYNTHRRGLPNTAGTATLVWQIASSGDIPPAEMTVSIEAPGQYGHSHVPGAHDQHRGHQQAHRLARRPASPARTRPARCGTWS